MKVRVSGLFAVFFIGLFLAGLYGWLYNCVKFVHMLHGDVTAMFIARITGIFVVPFGAVLGYF